MTDENIERGAAEEGSGSPLTPTEAEASQTAPSGSGSDAGGDVPGEHDEAESANNTDV
jgi:hypothetical protein